MVENGVKQGVLEYTKIAVRQYQILTPRNFLVELRKNQLTIEVLVDGKVHFTLDPFGTVSVATLGLSVAEKEANMIAEQYLFKYLTLFVAAAVMLKVKSLIVEVIAAIFIGLMIPLIFMRQMEDMKWVQPLNWSGEKYTEFLETMAQFHAEMVISLIEMAGIIVFGDWATKASLVKELGSLLLGNWIDFEKGRIYGVTPNIVGFAGIILANLAKNSIDGKVAILSLSLVGIIIHLILFFSFRGSL